MNTIPTSVLEDLSRSTMHDVSVWTFLNVVANIVTAVMAVLIAIKIY